MLVHGRGLHSKDNVPVLKDALRGWLATNRFSRATSSPSPPRSPADGGAGALYVLLRRAGQGLSGLRADGVIHRRFNGLGPRPRLVNGNVVGAAH